MGPEEEQQEQSTDEFELSPRAKQAAEQIALKFINRVFDQLSTAMPRLMVMAMQDSLEAMGNIQVLTNKILENSCDGLQVGINVAVAERIKAAAKEVVEDSMREPATKQDP